MENQTLEEIMCGLVSGDDTKEMSVTSDVDVVVKKKEQEDITKEVEEMKEQETFMSKNIDKDMNVLEKEFVSMERKAAIVDAKIDKIKRDNHEIFEKIAELELEKSEILKPKEDYREVIARKLFLMGEKKWSGLEVTFTYVAATFKDKFNMDKFKKEEPNVWAKYIEKNPVKEYIKTKLTLLPIKEEEMADGNESA